MDDITLAFLAFSVDHPELLEQVQALTEAYALEAGQSLPELRDTIVSQILEAEAEQRGVSLEALVQKLSGQSSQAAKEPDAVPGLEKYNQMRDFGASPEPSGSSKATKRSKNSEPKPTGTGLGMRLVKSYSGYGSAAVEVGSGL